MLLDYLDIDPSCPPSPTKILEFIIAVKCKHYLLYDTRHEIGISIVNAWHYREEANLPLFLKAKASIHFQEHSRGEFIFQFS